MFCLREIKMIGRARMTEFKAIAVTMAAGAAAEVIAFVLLHALHADGMVMAVAFVVILAAGADSISRVAMRYPEKRPRR